MFDNAYYGGQTGLCPAHGWLRMLRFLAESPASWPSVRMAARRELAELQGATRRGCGSEGKASW